MPGNIPVYPTDTGDLPAAEHLRLVDAFSQRICLRGNTVACRKTPATYTFYKARSQTGSFTRHK